MGRVFLIGAIIISFPFRFKILDLKSKEMIRTEILPVNVRFEAHEERRDLGRSQMVEVNTTAGTPAGLTSPGLEVVLAVPAEHSPALADPEEGSDILVITTADIAVEPEGTHDA